MIKCRARGKLVDETLRSVVQTAVVVGSVEIHVMFVENLASFLIGKLTIAGKVGERFEHGIMM